MADLSTPQSLRDTRERSAIAKALAWMPGIQSVVDLPGEDIPASDQTLALTAKSVDAIVGARFPIHLDRDDRRRLLRDVRRWRPMRCT